ncbi:hypothetical protein KW783_00515 [Candidatus Parcubacteria bacterium]|nr:hypothetical protein [Candidatus Parcubacteria bacterium]
MLVSYNELQTYFVDKLPPPEKLAELFTFHVFEVEGMEKRGDDTIFDAKVLPDRAHYLKSEAGIALEIRAITGLEIKGGNTLYKKGGETSIVMPTDFISKTLGVDISQKEIESILKRMDIGVSESKGELVLTIPSYRNDLKIPVDIAEEVGRIYDYEKIPSRVFPNSKAPINKTFYYIEKIKDVLVGEGFSEVYLYSIKNKGEIEIENPLASDKDHLRANLTDGLKEALEFNVKNADLLGENDIRIFEIGNVFTKKGEFLHLGLGVSGKKAGDTLKKTLEVLAKQFQFDTARLDFSKGIFEINLGDIIEKLPEPHIWDVAHSEKTGIYKPISTYPFSVRDIAVFVPENISIDKVREIIEKRAGPLLVHIKLFDEFKKTFPDGKTKISYGFRLVFQSKERTLSDSEIVETVSRVTSALNSQNGWNVR